VTREVSVNTVRGELTIIGTHWELWDTANNYNILVYLKLYKLHNYNKIFNYFQCPDNDHFPLNGIIIFNPTRQMRELTFNLYNFYGDNY